MEGKDRARIAIYSIGGIYLLIVAYNMFQNLDTIIGAGEYIISIVFIIVFGIAGAGMASLGIWDVYRNYKKMKEEYAKGPEEEKTSFEEEKTSVLDDKTSPVLDENEK